MCGNRKLENIISVVQIVRVRSLSIYTAFPSANAFECRGLIMLGMVNEIGCMSTHSYSFCSRLNRVQRRRRTKHCCTGFAHEIGASKPPSSINHCKVCSALITFSFSSFQTLKRITFRLITLKLTASSLLKRMGNEPIGLMAGL